MTQDHTNYIQARQIAIIVEIGNGYIKLQLHISKKILEIDPKSLEDLKTMRQFLGLINYARSYLKNISMITSSLYNTTNLKGQRYLNTEDYKII